MKIYLILILSIITGCSSYTVSKVSNEQVIVSKTTQVLFFWNSTVSTCNLDKEGIFELCEENKIQTEDEILKKQAQLKIEHERLQKLNQPIVIQPIKYEEPIKTQPIIAKIETSSIKTEKPSMHPKKDMDKNKFYIGIGLSTSREDVNSPDLDSAKFNYSLAYLKKESDYMYGGIYHVSAYRIFGAIPDLKKPNATIGFEQQVNINLLGASVRKHLTSTDESSPYIRLDGGLAWTTIGESMMLTPFDDSQNMGLGGNIGAGVSLKTDFGSINIDIYHTIYSSPESENTGSGMTNFTFGLMF